MKFLFPTFLFALFTVAIPLIIHLFSFKRYKTVYFSNVEFLKDIKKESKRKSRLKQILLLLARILTIIFLVFAFAQPYIPRGDSITAGGKQTVAIYIDNSFSMNALSEQGNLLEVAKNKAVEVCMAQTVGTTFRLYTNDLHARHQHNFSQEQIIRQISEIHPSPVLVPLSTIFNRFLMLNEDEKSNKSIFFISDFQRTISDFGNFRKTNMNSYYIPLIPNQVNNLYIDSCWVEEPAHRINQEEELFVKIKNNSNQDFQNLPLKLFLNDSIKSITNFSVEAHGEIISSLKFTNSTSGLQKGKIEITDYPFTHDNSWFLSYYVEPVLNALAIHTDSEGSRQALEHIDALFQNDDYVQLDKSHWQNLKISDLAGYNAIFLLQLEEFSSGFLNELNKSVTNGSSLVLFPDVENNPLGNNLLLSEFNARLINGIDTSAQKISGIDYENSFFDQVFKEIEENPVMPEINKHLRFQELTESTENQLLWFQNNDKALSMLRYNNGKFWIFSFPLSNENRAFTRDVLFVPTLYNIVINSVPQQKTSYTIGKNSFIDLARASNIDLNTRLNIENLESGERFIPQKTPMGQSFRLEFNDEIKQAGHYLVQSEDTTISSMAFNYNRMESDLEFFNGRELESEINSTSPNAQLIEDTESNFSEVFEELQNGKQLWMICILLALAFILTEVMISRFMK